MSAGESAAGEGRAEEIERQDARKIGGIIHRGQKRKDTPRRMSASN